MIQNEMNEMNEMEGLIPNSFFNENYIALWRMGSIEYTYYDGLLIIDKDQLKNEKLTAYYFPLDASKPGNFSNWKYTSVY